MKLFLLFTLVFYLEQPLVEWSKISCCLEGSTLPTRDGPLICGLPHSYNNFNLPTTLLSQVPLIWQASYIVSFYPQYILNFFTSLFIWLPGQRNVPPHLDTSKNTFQSIPSPEFLLVTRKILKGSIIKASKCKVQDTTEVIRKEDML